MLTSWHFYCFNWYKIFKAKSLRRKSSAATNNELTKYGEYLMKKTEDYQKVTLRGIITAVDWDDEENVISVSLSTPEEEEYIIEDTPIKEKFLDLIYQNVEVTGVIKMDEYGDKSILVNCYKVIEDEDDDF